MRLPPLKETLRKLYLRSGNNCAFPECKEVMINNAGVFIGQICHIKAAEPGGERYNPKQDDEDRRHYDNLMLLCYPHHKVTYNVNIYTVDVLKKMKKDHESKFSDIALAMGKSIVDWTENQKFISPNNLGKFIEHFKWDFEEYQITETIKEIQEIGRRLETLPLNSRKLFNIILKRLKRTEMGEDYVDPREIEEVAQITYHDLDRHTAILAAANFTSRINVEEYEDPSISVSTLNTGWKIWRDIIDYGKAKNIPLEEFIVDMDFSILDKSQSKID